LAAGVSLQGFQSLWAEKRLAEVPGLDGLGRLGQVAALAGWRQVAGGVQAASRQGVNVVKVKRAIAAAITAGVPKEQEAPICRFRSNPRNGQARDGDKPSSAIAIAYGNLAVA
jgi:hypothetical protein